MASGDEQLISYILRAREKGRMDEDISRSLYSVGWRKERVDTAFARIEEMKSEGVQPEGENHEAPAKPPLAQAGWVKLSAVPASQVPAQEKANPRIVPPTIRQPSSQEEEKPSVPSQMARKPLIQFPPIRRVEREQAQPGQKGQTQPEQEQVQPEPLPQQSSAPWQQPRVVIPPTIQAPAEKAPLDLPMGPQYQKVTDESQVQNPAFPKVAGGTSTLDFGMITRVILFVIIVAMVVYGYFYLTNPGAVIS